MLSLLLFGIGASAQSSSRVSVPISLSSSGTPTTMATATLSGYSYTSYPIQPVSSPQTTAGQPIPTDYSAQAWSLLWDQVGPISSNSVINSTVSPTPEPSPVPPPYGFSSQITTSNLSSYQLPKDFVWGVASAAFQVEGAANLEGRGPSIWDLLAHRVPGHIADNTNADVGDLHYYLYKQDIARLKAFNIPYFSLSISWSRVFPFGRGYVNQQALDHYEDVFKTLQAAGIKPIVTLFHWDTPLALMNAYNGWTSEEIVQDYFNYAKLIITRFDKYVPIWVSVNEALVYCQDEYPYFPSGYWPEYGVTGTKAAFYCVHNTLLSHGTVVDWYRNEFKGTGRWTMKMSANNFIANTSSAADAAAVKRGNDYQLGWFNDPMWLTGDYPESIKSTVPYLPKFTAAQSKMILGSCDFLAIDGYTTDVLSAPPGGIAACASNSSDPNWPSCVVQSQISASGWDIGYAADLGATWLKSVPGGLRQFLNYLQDTYTGPAGTDIVLTEFGFAEPDENNTATLADALYDQLRVDYFNSYLNALLEAKVEDGVNVTGAIAWGIFDNFEWGSGLSTKFGLQNVNYTTLVRTPKASMFSFTDFFKQHGL